MILYTDQGDTPIFCTSKDELGFVRGVFSERESEDESRVQGIQSLQSNIRGTAKIRFSL